MVAISRFKTKVNIIVLTGTVIKVIQFYLIKQITIAASYYIAISGRVNPHRHILLKFAV